MYIVYGHVSLNDEKLGRHTVTLSYLLLPPAEVLQFLSNVVYRQVCYTMVKTMSRQKQNKHSICENENRHIQETVLADVLVLDKISDLSSISEHLSLTE